MPYDPRMMAQLAQMGVGMMGPQQGSPFANDSRNNSPQRPKQWWEQPLPTPQRQGDDTNSSANSANSANQMPMSLLQMLMLGGKPTYSGKPQQQGGGGPGQPGPQAQPSPWAWLGGMYGGPR